MGGAVLSIHRLGLIQVARELVGRSAVTLLNSSKTHINGVFILGNILSKMLKRLSLRGITRDAVTLYKRAVRIYPAPAMNLTPLLCLLL